MTKIPAETSTGSVRTIGDGDAGCSVSDMGSLSSDGDCGAEYRTPRRCAL